MTRQANQNPHSARDGNRSLKSAHPKLATTVFICASLAVALLGFGRRHRGRPKQDPDLAVRARMLQISKELGVTCNYCHNPRNFLDGNKHAYKVGFAHIRMVEELNRQHILGLGRVNCATCHRGHAKPPPVQLGASPVQ